MRSKFNERWGYRKRRNWYIDAANGFYNIGGYHWSHDAGRTPCRRNEYRPAFTTYLTGATAPKLGWASYYGDITEMDETIKKYLPTKILERLIFQSEEDAAAEAA